jgi:hypothetical protein
MRLNLSKVLWFLYLIKGIPGLLDYLMNFIPGLFKQKMLIYVSYVVE